MKLFTAACYIQQDVIINHGDEVQELHDGEWHDAATVTDSVEAAMARDFVIHSRDVSGSNNVRIFRHSTGETVFI